VPYVARGEKMWERKYWMRPKPVYREGGHITTFLVAGKGFMSSGGLLDVTTASFMHCHWIV